MGRVFKSVPCPFCGKDDIHFQIDESPGMKWWGYVVCANCSAKGPDVRTNSNNSEKEEWHERALKEWETRRK